jgi:hypothetical protein
VNDRKVQVGLLRKNGYELTEFLVRYFVDVVHPKKLFELFKKGLDEFWKACSGSEIKVCEFAFGEVVASPKVETVLFRRLSVQLSLGELLSSRARLCLTGRCEFSRFMVGLQAQLLRIQKRSAFDSPVRCAGAGDCRTPRCNRRAPGAIGGRSQSGGGKPAPA